MTTNETFFFRDKVPFDHLRETVLPALMQARASRRSLRIWCAASSTGQEPYSIAMCLKEFAPALTGWRVEIVATDLSQGVLEKSRAGIFSQFEVQRGLPIQMLVKHFTQVGELWQLNADIRAMVQHRQLNLLQDFSHLGLFDVIFCRNVLIYFDQATKAGIFDRLARALEPDGVLTLGAAESVVGISDAFRPYPERRGLYRPNADRTAQAGAAAVMRRVRSSNGGRFGGALGSYRMACGRNRELLPVIGFSSSRIESPHGAWSISQLPITGYWLEKFGRGAKAWRIKPSAPYGPSCSTTATPSRISATLAPSRE